MRRRDDSISDPAKPILLWRIVAGAFLHFGLLAYLIVVPLALLLTAPRGATAEQIVRLALADSGRFLLLIGALALVATALAAVLDPVLRARRDRRAARDPRAPARLARQRLDEAAAIARGAFDGATAARVAGLTAAGWDLADPDAQALARDLAEVVRTSAVAAGTAQGRARADIVAMAHASLDHIGQELDALLADRAKSAEAAAATTARYVEMRYGGSDFAIRGD